MASVIFLLVGFLLALEGQYSGTWISDGGSGGGKVSMSVAAGQSDVTYTYQGQNIKTQPVSTKVDGDKVEVVFESDIDGLKLRTTFHGAVSGKDIDGKYRTVSAAEGAQVDSGTWKVSQQ